MIIASANDCLFHFSLCCIASLLRSDIRLGSLFFHSASPLFTWLRDSLLFVVNKWWGSAPAWIRTGGRAHLMMSSALNLQNQEWNSGSVMLLLQPLSRLFHWNFSLPRAAWNADSDLASTKPASKWLLTLLPKVSSRKSRIRPWCMRRLRSLSLTFWRMWFMHRRCAALGKHTLNALISSGSLSVPNAFTLTSLGLSRIRVEAK